MTQEQLAEALSISPQAVSRRETDIAMPDISLIPTPAYLFDVTTDHLLGVDITKKDAQVNAIVGAAERQGRGGDLKAAAEIVRAGLRGKPYGKFICSGKENHARGLLMQLEAHAGEWQSAT